MVDPNAGGTVPEIGIDAARHLVAEQGAVVIDVREAGELAETGKLAGALHVPLGAVEAAAPGLPRDVPILLYCRAGVRSAAAGATLRALGFERLFNLGGFARIADAGWPVESA